MVTKNSTPFFTPFFSQAKKDVFTPLISTFFTPLISTFFHATNFHTIFSRHPQRPRARQPGAAQPPRTRGLCSNLDRSSCELIAHCTKKPRSIPSSTILAMHDESTIHQEAFKGACAQLKHRSKAPLCPALSPSLPLSFSLSLSLSLSPSPSPSLSLSPSPPCPLHF